MVNGWISKQIATNVFGLGDARIRKTKLLITSLSAGIAKPVLAAVKFQTMLEKLKQELEECKRLWSKYSCDCLHFEILSLEKRIAELSV